MSAKTRQQQPPQPPEFIDLDDGPSQDGSHDSGDEHLYPIAKKVKKEPSSCDSEKSIVEYHAVRRNEHIPIYKFDLDTLADKEFLNDTILSFYLA